MTLTNSSGAPLSSRTRGIADLARRHLGGRRVLLILAGLALVLGLAFKWDWLVAAGIAPILLGFLPCAVMCAIGVGCAHMMSSRPKEPLPPAATAKPDGPPEAKP